MADSLLVVDVQQCFLNEYTRHIPTRIQRLIRERAYERLYFTCFVNVPDSYYPRLQAWHACGTPEETALAEALRPLAGEGRLFEKRGIAGLPSELKEQLRGYGVRRLDVVGIDTDMCVLKCAMDLFDMRIEPVIWADCCASTAGMQAHLAGLAILGRNVGPKQLRLTGLFEEYLAAP